MEIDHIAIVVKDLEHAIALYTATLGCRQVYRETIADQGVEAVGIDMGPSMVELLRPLDEESPVARYRGEAQSRLHHLAYRVPNIEAELARLKSLGVRLIDEHPRNGAHGNLVAFLHPKSTGGVLLEICERAQ